MPLPHVLAKPIFHMLYLINRRRDGATVPPIRRIVQPVEEEKQFAFDDLFDSAQELGPNALIDYNLVPAAKLTRGRKL